MGWQALPILLRCWARAMLCWLHLHPMVKKVSYHWDLLLLALLKGGVWVDVVWGVWGDIEGAGLRRSGRGVMWCVVVCCGWVGLGWVVFGLGLLVNLTLASASTQTATMKSPIWCSGMGMLVWCRKTMAPFCTAETGVSVFGQLRGEDPIHRNFSQRVKVKGWNHGLFPQTQQGCCDCSDEDNLHSQKPS